MSKRQIFVFLAAALFCSPGCGLNRPNFRWPGTVHKQQTRATFHDPYADQNAGPNADGFRPRDFSQPRSEPVRAQVLRDNQVIQ